MSSPVVIDVNGRRTRIHEVGNPADPPLLLLHGIGRSLEDWAPQLAHLAGTHHVISLDLPGSGFSGRVRGSTTLPVLARSVFEMLDALGEHRPVHIIGNSLGGAVAMQMAAARPDRVAGLVLVNSAGFGREVTAALRLLAVPILGEIITRRTTRAGARLTEKMTFADPALATRARIDHAIAIAQQPDTAPVMLETTRALATFRGIKVQWRTELVARVAELRPPTLIVWGDQDRILPAAHLAAAQAALPHADCHLFQGVGHMPQIECPERFADRVLPFLDGVVRSADALVRPPR
jgi:pimeloyl-ACP methyl ester carboxylesterase